MINAFQSKIIFIICLTKLQFAVRARGERDKSGIKYPKALTLRKHTHQPCCDSDKHEFEKPDVALLDPMSRSVSQCVTVEMLMLLIYVLLYYCMDTVHTRVNHNQSYQENVDLPYGSSSFFDERPTRYLLKLYLYDLLSSDI